RAHEQHRGRRDRRVRPLGLPGRPLPADRGALAPPPARPPQRRDRAVTAPTESHRSELHDLDLRPTHELVELINREDESVARAVGGATRALAGAIDAIAARLERGGRLVYAGAGSSGLIAALDAAECG